MNKFSKIIIVFLILLNNCAYEPIFKKKNINFTVELDNLNGDKKINSILKNRFSNYNTGSKKFNISIESIKEKIIISKDSKGDPSIFEISINVFYVVKDNEKIIVEDNIIRKNTYDNISDKFELAKFEEIIIKNLTESISNDILLSISSIYNNDN